MEILLLFAQLIQVDGLPDVQANSSTLANVFSVASMVAGAISILFLLIGAGRYATSGGEPGQTKQARDTILYSVIGLVVSTSAFLIVQFVLGRISNT